MKLRKIKEILDAQVVCGEDALNMEVETGCGADLMSDVLAFAKANSILLTGLTNQQLVRTAEMADIKALCLVRGKEPSDECIQLAKSKKIPVLKSRLPMFEACGRLYKAGLPGGSEA